MLRDCYNYFVTQFGRLSKQLVQFSFQDFLKRKQLESGERPKRKTTRRTKKTLQETQKPIIQENGNAEVRLTHFWPQLTTPEDQD
jgi:hypothetical protein